MVEENTDSQKSTSEVIELSDNIGSLLYQSDNSWSSVNLSPINRDILQEFAWFVDKEKSASIITPFYSPKVLVLYALELLYQNVSSNPRLCIVTAGGQGSWGSRKTDVYSEIKKYGLTGSTFGEPNADNLISDIFSVYSGGGDNGLTEYSNSGSSNGEIIIVSSFEDIDRISSPDAIIVNAASRVKENWTEMFEQYRNQYDCPFYLISGLYTKNESETFPEFVPPNVISIPSIPSELVVKESDGKFTDDKADNDFKGMNSSDEIKVVDVGGEDILSKFKDLNRITSELSQKTLPELGNKILYKQFFLERAPVPLRLYDAWIDRERERSDSPYIPSKSRGKIASLEQEKDNFDESFVPGTLNEAVGLLQEIREEIAETNPIYDHIKSELNKDIRAGRTAAILVRNQSLQSIFEFTIEKDTGVTTEELEEKGIKICGPSQARSLPQIDKLYIPGPVHPRIQAFYVLPQADQVNVLTFGGRWKNMINKHASDYVSYLNDIFSLGEELRKPEIDVMKDKEVELEKQPEIEDTGQVSLMKTFWRDYTSEQKDRESDRDGSKFEVYFDNNKEFAGRGDSKKLRKVENDVLTEGKYTWTKLQNLSADDKIVELDSEFMDKLWREELKEIDEDIGESNELLEGIKRWYQALNRLINHQNSYRDIYRKLNEQDNDISYSQVQAWLNSVKNAEGALDLIENPGLTIGPRHARHIKALGEVFDLKELKGNSREIESTMKAFRVLNRRKGSNFRLKIIDKISKSEEDIMKASSVNTVKSVRELKGN